LVFLGRRLFRAARTQEHGLECGLAEYEIQHRGVVRLDEEEEDLLERNVKERGANDDMAGIAPDVGANEVGIPWYCSGDSDLPLLLRGPPGLWCSTYGHQEQDLEGIKSGKQRPVQQGKQHGRRYGVFGMATRSGSVCASLQVIKCGSHVHNRIVKAHSVGGRGAISCALRDVC
jgi:hypothetical protein